MTLFTFTLFSYGINPNGFPNSIVSPLRGWRSWNAVFEDVTQSFITRQVEAITARTLVPPGGSSKKSLFDLGYTRVGIDAGWASCDGVNGSWHDASGHFIVNLTRFPDMKQMNADAHERGVKMGFYLNQDGSCPEGKIPGAAANTGNFASYANDIEDMVALDFDAVKFDSGGGNDDTNRWADEIFKSDREIMIENCNNGGYVPYKPPTAGARGGGDAPVNCPFNMFRTGIDIAPSPLSVVSNLLDASHYFNVSVPGCYAYPDMLELGAPVVGQYASPTRRSLCNATDGTVGDSAPRLSVEQGRAQFAAWCTVSSPLILGFDLGNETEYATWFPIVTNPLALRIQAAYVANTTGVLLARDAATITTTVPHGASCEDMKDSRALPRWTLVGKPIAPFAPGSGTKTTSWALTAINTDQAKPSSVSVALSAIGMAGAIAVTETDVWTGKETLVRPSDGRYVVSLPPGGHRFVVLESTAHSDT